MQFQNCYYGFYKTFWFIISHKETIEIKARKADGCSLADWLVSSLRISKSRLTLSLLNQSSAYFDNLVVIQPKKNNKKDMLPC